MTIENPALPMPWENDAFASAIFNGLLTIEEAEVDHLNGFYLEERNIGGINRVTVTPSGVKHEFRQPSLDEEISKKLLEYDNPDLDEWTLVEWQAMDGGFLERRLPLATWVLEIAQFSGKEFLPRDASIVARKVIQILYDIEMSEQTTGQRDDNSDL